MRLVKLHERLFYIKIKRLTQMPSTTPKRKNKKLLNSMLMVKRLALLSTMLMATISVKLFMSRL